MRWDLILNLDIGAHACDPVLGKLRQEDCSKFKERHSLTRPNKPKLNIKIPFLKSCGYPKEKNFLDTTSLGLARYDWFVQHLQSGGISLEFKPNLKIIGTCTI